ncbi:LysR family transcriptional regulator [Acidisoma cellulosilytica]|uniref:LysR family transcriptional regulator n=1 Tax=Acidisoma cellulosilyticum TaxID=2802395 RepID=A0A963Z5H4_9PROT|nr:LysR substrate-binding domain-containing protein [Acidisoma cellulosilyticum]MCB8882851.1 LysR family transcriptional regulator [Acidisoma cellulosilyticum]
MTQRLPPLNAIKAFEVAAREGSFALAAVELGVSPAAVSQQIRNLEDFFGKQLFARTGNRVTLTDAGRAIYPETTRALRDLAAMTTRLLEGEQRTRLVVSVPFSLAEFWLAPKLAMLVQDFPHLAMDVRVEDDPIDLLRQNIDLRISYGDYHYPAMTAIPLIQDEVLPVCAPSFWHQHRRDAFGIEDIHDGMLIHTNWGPSFASHPTWADWFAKAGSARRPDASLGRRVGLSSLALSSARLGLGVALGQKALAWADLEAGRLIALSPTALRLGHPYCAFTPGAGRLRPEVRALLALLSTAPR